MKEVPKVEQMTFTEDEIKQVEDFLNFVFTHAKYELTTKESFAYNAMYGAMAQHVKKCRNYIFEFVKETGKPKNG